MKIHVYYRHAALNNLGRYRPHWFGYEKCFLNFLSTIQNYSNVSLNVVMDGDPSNDFINKYTSLFNLIQVNYSSEYKSWVYAVNHAHENNSINDSDLIYFLENDYLHVPGWPAKVVELYKTFTGLSYVSLYDHNDKYMSMYDDLVSKVFSTETHHWRTTPSTCASFITTKNILNQDIDLWLRPDIGDHSKFGVLSSTKNRFVLTPIPGLSTHCMEGLCSPAINWERISNNVI